MSNSSFTISCFLFFNKNLLTCSLHSMNQLAMLLTSPYLGLDSCSKIHQRGLRSAQPCWLWRSTHFTFPSSANQFDSSPTPAQSLPPTLPPSPRNVESAGVSVTLLHYAKKRHKTALSALSCTTAPPTDVLTKAVRKEVLRSP